MFGILGLNAILFYYTTMMPSGTHGIIENLDVLLMVLQVLFFESLAFIAIFCVFTAYLEKPYLVGILYWIIWESFVSGQNYQKLTITHYLNSILFDSMAAARTLVVTNLKEQRTIVEGANCGLVSDFSPEDISKKIVTLLKNQKKLEKMGNNGRNAVEIKNSWDKRAKDILEKIF